MSLRGAKPRLVAPQIFFVWHAPPKLLGAEASVAAQFATKVRLVRIPSFGRDACPVNTRLFGVRSQQQRAFHSCKAPQRARNGPVIVRICGSSWRLLGPLEKRCARDMAAR